MHRVSGAALLPPANDESFSPRDSLGDLTTVASRTHAYSYDYKTGAISADVAEQAEQCMANIAAALSEAGAAVADIVRVRYMLPDRGDFPTTWPVLRRWLGEVRPAATMIVAGLMKEEMRIEVEVTARRKGVTLQSHD